MRFVFYFNIQLCVRIWPYDTINTYFSVMKKSKMDWEAHRKKDNLEEELNNVKNSKKSIVDKNDFLLRTDHRTFELEREERLKRINNRKNN